jgi:N-acetylmuramoyl-L-alanine amidase
MKRFTKILSVSALFAITAFAPLTATQTAIAAPGQATSVTSAVSTNDPFSYIVQPGDNLTNIANTYGTTVSAILALNPKITDPNLIYPGEVLQIPQGQISSAIIPLTGPAAEVTPVFLTPGSKIQVSVSGFPHKTGILVSAHPLNSTQIEVTKDATTSGNGKVTVSVKLPANLNGYYSQTWVVQVSTTSGTYLSVTSNQFVVGISTNPYVGIGPFTYVVRSGDYLSLIAREYGTSVAAILAVNPQITNQSTIYPGEVIIIPYGVTAVPPVPVIPLTGTFAEIVPSSGPQGANIQVVINGFPANTRVKVGLHKLNRKLIESTAYATTNAYGTVTVTMQIPVGANINNNRVWLAQVSTTSGTSLTVNSNPFYVTGN